MAKRALYVSRPCRALDSPALWDWLERYHPEIMSRFRIVFSQEIERLVRGTPPQYHKLSEHVMRFMEEPTWESMTEIRAPIQIAINDLWAARSHLAQSQRGDALQDDIERSTMTVKLPKDHENTFCGLTFICPICGGRNCVWRRLRRQGRTWIDEHYCTNTGHTLQAEDLLASLKVDHDEPLPAFIEFHLGEQAAHE